jgi:hypothetical protein
MPTLMANDAMRSRLVKVAKPLPRPAAQHAVHKSPKPPAVAQQKPVIVQPAPVEDDPELKARRREQLERKSALWQRLCEISPALFATHQSPPMAVGTYHALIERLGLDAGDAGVLKRIMKAHVHRPAYQAALAAPGSMRLDIDGRPAGEVSADERTWAAIRFEHLKAQLKAKRQAAREAAAAIGEDIR